MNNDTPSTYMSYILRMFGIWLLLKHGPDPTFFGPKKKRLRESTVHASARAGRMTKTQPESYTLVDFEFF